LGLSLRAIAFGAAVVAVFFAGTLWALDTFLPQNPMAQSRPALTALPPLQPVTRTSMIVAPVAIANLAIRDAIEANAPRTLNGKNENPLSELLGKADIGWTVSRGPIAMSGAPSGLTMTAALNGSMRATGQIATQGGNLTGALTGLLGNDLGRSVQKLTTRVLDQRADIRGNVTVTSHPAIESNWRIEPNLSGRVALADGGMTIAGIKLNIANEVKPLLDRTVDEQIGRLSNRLRNDPMLEIAARKEWAQMCRSIALGATAKDAPDLWLEVRPTKAFAAQPRILQDWVILTLGVQAETRIVPTQTRPNCPFPATVDLVQQLDQGKVTLAMPIDLPFDELNRVMEQQLKGRTFPEHGDAPAQVTVLASHVAASGDRLLISLRVKAKETKSWFGLGAEATVHIWGKPTLDAKNQVMRLTDIALDVRSQAAFGLLGAAARAAIPYLQDALADNAVIDLKPFMGNAKKSIQASLADFQRPVDGIEVEAAIDDLRLTGIEFDSKTLRVIAEADGTARALVRKIAFQYTAVQRPINSRSERMPSGKYFGLRMARRPRCPGLNTDCPLARPDAAKHTGGQ
jgi:hypothetical protein